MSMEVGMESVPMWRRPMEALSSEGVKELHRLQAENAKLRESFEFANNEWEKESLEFLSMRDENTKLRELVRELYEMAQPEAPSMFEAEFADRMRELGVEL